MPNIKFVISIMKFLERELEKPDVSEDTKEALDVALQCLQTAYDIENKDVDAPENILPFTLEDVFLSACQALEKDVDPKSTASERAEAMKNLGNNLMKSDQFEQAVKHYTAAIELDNQNAIYFGNRAAAYSKLNDFENAIKDCKKAIFIDPMYAKAYGRMGLAYANLEQHDLAIQAFKEAVLLDPENESYQSNLKIAEERKAETPGNPQANPGGIPGLNNVDWQGLFTNPTFRNMATRIVQDPSLINVMAHTMNQGLDNFQPPNAAESNSGQEANRGDSSRSSLDVLMEAGQYLAAQMAQANPELVEQFRLNTARVVGPRNPADYEEQDPCPKTP